MKVKEARYWWEMLEEEKRLEIFRNNNPDDLTDDWGDWWYHMSEKEQEEIYNENIEEVNEDV